uniref:Uncharacterized protein n=1 Tax=Plectus sambesii TaxID=2011161 RepID=A0A914UKS7_9BILA
MAFVTQLWLAANPFSDIPQTNGEVTVNDHPLQSIEKLRPNSSIKANVEERKTLGGVAQSERYYAELNAAAQVSRLPGCGSGSRLHSDVLLGNDETITFDDYLNHSDFDKY